MSVLREFHDVGFVPCLTFNPSELPLLFATGNYRGLERFGKTKAAKEGSISRRRWRR